MTYTGDSSTFVPSHLRPISAGERWIIDRTADTFVATGEWPNLEKLTRDALRGEVDLPELIYGAPVRDFLWRPDNDGTVVLSIPGLWRSAVGKPFVEKFLQVVLLCRDIYLGEPEGDDDEPPKITSEHIRFRLGFDDGTIARVHEELRFEYFLTAGGGSTSSTAWFYHVNQLVAKFRNVNSVEDYFEARKTILAPRAATEIWPEVSTFVDDVGDASASTPAPAPENVSESLPVVDPRMVFVVHGRDDKAKDAMWAFLESLGLHPLDWNEMVRRTGKGTPHTLRVVEVGFTMAKAFVVLMTPDDEARLHADLREPHDPDDERNMTCQPRPNVMFEAGRAFGTAPDSTIIVHIGKMRRVSDLDGLNVVRIGQTKAPLMALADRLEACGCPIDRLGLSRFDPARFAKLPSHHRAARDADHPDHSGPRVGRRLSSAAAATPAPRLTVKLWDHGDRNHLLEIANRGPMTLRQVAWELSDGAHNWSILSQMLPEYPIPELAPQRYVRVPVAISTGGPAYVNLTVYAHTETGDRYDITEQLSIYG